LQFTDYSKWYRNICLHKRHTITKCENIFAREFLSPWTKVPGDESSRALGTKVPVFIRGFHSVVCWPSHTRESTNSDGHYSHSSNLNNANKNCGSHQQRRYWISGRPSKAHHSSPVRSLQLVEVWQYLKERKKERKSVMSTARKPYCANGYLWWVHIKHASAHWQSTTAEIWLNKLKLLALSLIVYKLKYSIWPAPLYADACFIWTDLWWFSATDFITLDLWPFGLLTVLTLILCITRYGVYYRNVCIENLLKTERWWTEAASDWSVVWHPAKCRWSRNWPWPIASLPRCICQSQMKAFWIHAMMCCSTTVSSLLWNLHYSFFVSKLYQSWFLADRTNGRAYATLLRLSSSSVCNVMYCG